MDYHLAAGEHRAQMMASAQIIRMARQPGSGHRRAHTKTLPARWARRLATWRIRALPAVQKDAS